jgi:LysR family glycine cleavage system transcriptional activator
MTQKISLDSLRIFDSAARLSSFTGAGQETGMTQSAVSQQIKKLEEVLGVALFDRSGRRIVLTPAGERLWEAARQALAVIDRTVHEIVSNDSHQAMIIRTYPSFASRWLMPRMQDLRAFEPQVDFSIEVDVEPPDFITDNVDLAIVYGKQRRPEWTQLYLFGDAVFPVCTPEFRDDHGLAEPSDLRRAFLLHDSLVDCAYSTSWDKWLGALGVTLPPYGTGMSFSMATLALEGALAGQGVALGRLSLVAGELRSGALVRPFRQIVHEDGFYLAFPKHFAGRVAVQRFAEWLQAQASDYRRETLDAFRE